MGAHPITLTLVENAVKKLRLDVEALSVMSFETVAQDEEPGTVEAAANMITGTYPTCTTCKSTIVGTCCTP